VKSLSLFVVHLADLVEAEGRVLRGEAARFLTAGSVLIAGATIGLAGAGFMLTAIYVGLARVNVELALVVTGLFALGTGGLLIWLARRATR